MHYFEKVFISQEKCNIFRINMLYSEKKDVIV